MVDVGIQSEAEDLSDTELSAPVTADRKPSVLEAVPEEEHEDIELVITLFTPESKELVHLVAKWEQTTLLLYLCELLWPSLLTFFGFGRIEKKFSLDLKQVVLQQVVRASFLACTVPEWNHLPLNIDSEHFF